MSTAPQRQVIVLLPPLGDGETPDKLLQAAAGLAPGQTLQVLALRGPQGAALAPQPTANPTRWWDLHHPGLQRLDADALVPLWQQALAQTQALSTGPALLLLPPGPLGEECAARLAAKLGAAPLGRCSDVALQAAEVRAHRAAYGGRAEMVLTSSAACCVASWRPAGRPDAAAATCELYTQALQLDTPLPTPAAAQVLESADKMPALEGAPLVVSGGRGMAGDAGFALLAQVADKLGASLGGSLPTVDAGWVPVARQIGQSGKFVNPRVYFAVGISGTPQHMAGVSGDSRIVAVNKDPAAPIFSRADVGVVAEWETLLPALLTALDTAD